MVGGRNARPSLRQRECTRFYERLKECNLQRVGRARNGRWVMPRNTKTVAVTSSGRPSPAVVAAALKPLVVQQLRREERANPSVLKDRKKGLRLLRKVFNHWLRDRHEPR